MDEDLQRISKLLSQKYIYADASCADGTQMFYNSFSIQADSIKRLEAHYLSNAVEVSVYFIFIKIFI